MQDGLKRIFSEPIARVKARESDYFDQATVGHAKLVLHGAGNLGRKTLAGLRKAGIEPLAFSEANPVLWGKEIEGLQVISPKEAVEKFGAEASFVVCIWSPGADRSHAAVAQALKEMGCRSVVSFIPLFWKYPGHFLPHFRMDLPHKLWDALPAIERIFSLLCDERSREEYLRQIEWMIAPEVLALPDESSVADLCFPPGLFKPSKHEVFVDCGAYDGDTLRNLLSVTGGQFDYAYCFEPDPLNFAKLETFIATLPPETANRITAMPAAVGAVKTTLRMDSKGTVSSMISDSGTVEVDCVRLDDTIEKTPTYIQMDIEGFEPDALAGAERLIRAHTPRLGIRLYHIQDHLWTIPEQILGYSDRYRFYIRRHGDAFGDVVLYALPPG